ncbi:hypothetical protein K7432_001202 [Basidiobolus ranarum]|uniref:FAS1 domain-containing protein n=1 Tax=Basidiobolus ranarum TaxID=34480 RepID=A0ABR2X3D8_9FUNG
MSTARSFFDFSGTKEHEEEEKNATISTPTDSVEKSSEEDEVKETRNYGKSNTVLEILDRDGRFSELLKSLSSSNSNFQNDLSDPRNQVTIFAPTDKAFEAFNKHHNVSREKLQKILDYHIISDIVDEEDIRKSDVLATNYITPELFNEPQRVLIERKGGHLYLNYGTKVSEANIEARNGIVHIIKQVLELPKSIPKQLEEFSQFSIFLKALKKSGLEKEFKEPGLTVFVPSNFAFKSLGRTALDYLFSSNGREDLRDILLSHISPELIYAGDLKLPADGRVAQNSIPRDNDLEERLPNRRGNPDTNNGNESRYRRDNGKQRAQESEDIEVTGRHNKKHSDYEDFEDFDVYSIDYPSWIRGEKLVLRIVTDYKDNIDITINRQARVILADGIVENGVIHVIDRVLLLPDIQLPKLQWHEVKGEKDY